MVYFNISVIEPSLIAREILSFPRRYEKNNHGCNKADAACNDQGIPVTD